MASQQLASTPSGTPPRPKAFRRTATLVAIGLAWGLSLGPNRPTSAGILLAPRPNPFQATSSPAARRSALRSFPFEKLDAKARAKVASVLSNVTVFRRMPVRVVDCDPDLYLFLIRHPDVVVNIWEVLRIGNLELRQTGPDTYRVVEAAGTLASVEFLYRSHDTHVIYAEGTYDGPLLARPVKGRCLMVLKSGYLRETNGRYYVTSRLDTFLNVEPGGVELLTKTFHPLMGKTADLNFIQSVAFLGSLSRTAELNTRGVQRLASKLAHVQPELRQRLAELAAEIARKYAASSVHKTTAPQVASRTEAKPKR